MKTQICPKCNNEFKTRVKQICCSRSCAKLGAKLSESHKQKISKGNKGKKLGKVGKKWTEETRMKMIPILTGRKWKEESKLKIKGKNHYRYIKDRSKLAKKQNRNDSAYKEWRKQVWLRDNFKCKIANPDCKGKIEAHHILGWSEHPELRYEINNGITLCHAHHPRKRAEEKRLSPYFMGLVSVSKI